MSEAVMSEAVSNQHPLTPPGMSEAMMSEAVSTRLRLMEKIDHISALAAKQAEVADEGK